MTTKQYRYQNIPTEILRMVMLEAPLPQLLELCDNDPTFGKQCNSKFWEERHRLYYGDGIGDPNYFNEYPKKVYLDTVLSYKDFSNTKDKNIIHSKKEYNELKLYIIKSMREMLDAESFDDMDSTNKKFYKLYTKKNSILELKNFNKILFVASNDIELFLKILEEFSKIHEDYIDYLLGIVMYQDNIEKDTIKTIINRLLKNMLDNDSTELVEQTIV
jgi:hypothetical protein